MDAGLEVSFDGLQVLGDALQQQADELGSVSGFVRANCGHLDAFTGLLTLFSATYGEAFESMSEALRTGAEGSQARSGAMAATLADYIDSDDRIAGAMNVLGPRISAGPGPVPGGWDGALPGVVTTVGDAARTVTEAPGMLTDAINVPTGASGSVLDRFNPASAGPSITAPVDLYEQVKAAVDTGRSVREGVDDIGDYREFIDAQEDQP